MTGRLQPPFLSYDALRRRAEDFLRTHHPQGTIPIPIEEIVEFRYRIDIIPVPGLQEAFVKAGHSAVMRFISGETSVEGDPAVSSVSRQIPPVSDAVASSYGCLSPSRRAPLLRKASGSIVLVACSNIAEGLAHAA